MRNVNPEIRAAEIVADFASGSVPSAAFGRMSRGEQDGWDLHDDEEWGPDSRQKL